MPELDEKRSNMQDSYEMAVIARVHSDFSEKFGIPRQSGLVPELRAELVFEPAYRNPDALRGIEGFSHLWLIWGFSECAGRAFSPTVRPPRLGGNERMGVFATRSPFRPNPIGLSCVRLLSVRQDAERGMVLELGGADLMDGTPVFDVKPYLPYADCIPDAVGGFAPTRAEETLTVEIPPECAALVPPDRLEALRAVLAHDPRPAYQRSPERVYGLSFAGLQVRFRVENSKLTVQEITR